MEGVEEAVLNSPLLRPRELSQAADGRTAPMPSRSTGWCRRFKRRLETARLIANLYIIFRTFRRELWIE